MKNMKIYLRLTQCLIGSLVVFSAASNASGSCPHGSSVIKDDVSVDTCELRFDSDPIAGKTVGLTYVYLISHKAPLLQYSRSTII